MHLSVIIPTLNRPETATLLAHRIRELLPALETEVIVVTPVAGERSTSDERVHYITEAARGVYAAYNAGLRSASGEYVWFMGDDDYPLDAVTGISGILQVGAVDLLIAPVLFSSGRLYRPTRTLLLLHFLNWCQQGVIYRRRELLRHRFFRRLTVLADQYVNILLRSDSASQQEVYDRTDLRVRNRMVYPGARARCGLQVTAACAGLSAARLRRLSCIPAVDDDRATDQATG